jgi:hypothetical protein
MIRTKRATTTAGATGAQNGVQKSKYRKRSVSCLSVFYIFLLVLVVRPQFFLLSICTMTIALPACRGL